MDRYDEKRDRMDELTIHRDERMVDRDADSMQGRDIASSHMADRDAADRDTADERDREPMREGDVLGLSGAPVPKSPGDPTTEHDPASVAQRRARAMSDEHSVSEPADPSNQGGATGIDMGGGGQSTLLRRPRS